MGGEIESESGEREETGEVKNMRGKIQGECRR